ncbi:MAG: type 1 glutamine amidotransferase [Candidatus Peregrinibacteria bacterium]|nr:type 1 glutamine amidotransferase [Candidatus Peregrinibacteria bacterium]
MKPVAILVNCSREGPGLIATLLERHAIPFRTYDLDAGDSLPPIGEISACIILGSPDSANDESLKIIEERALLKEALQRKIPCFGVCLGLQLLVKAAGGIVRKNAVQEIGMRNPKGTPYRVTLKSVHERDPLLAGVPHSFPVFQLHGETVAPTPLMENLGRSPECENQLVRITPTAYGVQFHTELTEEMLRAWIAADPDLRRLDAQQLLADFHRESTNLHSVFETMFTNFLSLTGLVSDPKPATSKALVA